MVYRTVWVWAGHESTFDPCQFWFKSSVAQRLAKLAIKKEYVEMKRTPHVKLWFPHLNLLKATVNDYPAY